MELTNSFDINLIRRELITNNLAVKAIIQDINNCVGPLSVLQELNTVGRQKITALRKNIEQLNDEFIQIDDGDESQELFNEIDSHRRQLTSTLVAFRKANMNAMLAIEKCDKNQLLDSTGIQTKSDKAGKAGLLKVSSNVTNKLMSISKQLADTTQQSAQTLEKLATSSTTVQGTNDELINTKSTIGQSGKLLDKYGRREFTDKILLFFAFSLFLACVLYIVQKRLL